MQNPNLVGRATAAFVGPAVLFLCVSGCAESARVAPSLDAAVIDTGHELGLDSAIHTDSSTDVQVRWTEGPPLPFGLDHLGAFTHRSGDTQYVYVMGGRNQGRHANTNAVLRAELGDDGILGEFVELEPMPSSRAAYALVVVDDSLFIVGGASASQPPPTLSARIDADGALVDWTENPALPETRYHLSAVASDGFLYAIGGFEAPPTDFREVYRAATHEDGTIGEWSPVTSLPSGRSHHASVVVDHAIYVIGGLNGVRAAPSVLRAAIDADGDVSDWQEIGTMSDSVSTHAAFALGNSIYVVGGYWGGYNSENVSNRVRRVVVGSDGTLGEWTDLLQNLPEGREHLHYVAATERYLVVAGGRTATGDSSDQVFVGEFTRPDSP